MGRPLLLLLLAAAPLAAQPADTLRAPGLRAPVTLLRDSAGVVHVRAASEHDLFYAQGWNAARDRLFQLELWRRQATGTMAEALGPRWVERDRASRLLRYRGDMTRELAHYHPRGAAIVQAFVDGVNAWVDRAARDTTLLPPELRALGIAPGRWTPAVVVSRHNALVQNAESEIDRAQLVARVGAARVRAVGAFEPDPVVLDPDPALDVAALSDSVLAIFRLYRAPLTFERGEVRTAALDAPEAGDAWDGAREGSNNWAVAGERTASGKPLLANDPHRTIAVPSLRYMVHLTAPGWDVIGGGEPAIPGVSLGHNRHGAWGLTVFGMDMADVYAYRLDPSDHGRHRWRDGWARIRTVVDTIRVRGEAPRVVRLQYTRHGPVTWVDSARHLAYALRAAWLEPGGAPYLASLRLDQARTWDEFRAGLRYAHVPALNWVWADTGGTIGWQAAGIAPVRRGWSGLLPVPGDGRHEWDGFLPVPELPHHVNPARGWVGTANEMNVPADYARADAVGRAWAEPFRSRRLAEVLDSARKLTVEDMTALQHDETSLPARALVAALREAAVPPAAAAARAALPAWDHVLRADSPAAGIYVAWERALSRTVARRAGAGPVALR
ncbi:penicillin acylase family protein, partial [Roseisolibacter sp. H3M3-2]|uniref:penicillin acylase family protein n=1 Tax=Roseisolibacter sp. H3M3-2 TaxID=3031323 RepID=UPI0023DB5A04